MFFQKEVLMTPEELASSSASPMASMLLLRLNEDEIGYRTLPMLGTHDQVLGLEGGAGQDSRGRGRTRQPSCLGLDVILAVGIEDPRAGWGDRGGKAVASAAFGRLSGVLCTLMALIGATCRLILTPLAAWAPVGCPRQFSAAARL